MRTKYKRKNEKKEKTRTNHILKSVSCLICTRFIFVSFSLHLRFVGCSRANESDCLTESNERNGNEQSEWQPMMVNTSEQCDSNDTITILIFLTSVVACYFHFYVSHFFLLSHGVDVFKSVDNIISVKNKRKVHQITFSFIFE